MSSDSTLIPRQPNIQFTNIIVMYTHTCMAEIKYPNIGRYGHTQGRTNPKPLSQNRRTGPYLWGLTIYRRKVSSGPPLLPRQPNIQFTIIIVIYTHTCLEEKKYPNIGWYRHTQGHTNPKTLSQNGRSGPYFRCITIYV